MKNAMFVGLAIGMLAGACIASNSNKARKVVTDTQEQIKNKLCPQKEQDEFQGSDSGME